MAEERAGAAPQETVPLVTKKKKKRGGGSFVFLLLLLAFGVGTGLHFSGLWDARPIMWSVVPKIPYVGNHLATFFGVPEQYTLTVAERRAYELEEWQKRLDERERGLGTRETALEAASGDVEARLARLSQQQAVAQQNIPGKAGTPTAASDAEKKLIDQVAKTYQDMSPRNAAQIVEQISEPLAVELLQKLPIDIRGAILGKMDPKKAARLTELMTLERQ